MTENWIKEFEEFESTGEAYGIELRLSLSDIIINGLQKRGLSQKDLAERMGVREPIISRLIHAESNCTFETAGRVLHALEIDADLVEKERVIGDSSFDVPIGIWIPLESSQHATEEIVKEKSGTEGRFVNKGATRGSRISCSYRSS